MSVKFRFDWLIIIILAVLILSAGVICTDRISTGFFLTGQPALAENHDLNCDGVTESYILENRCLKIMENGLELWQSPADWKVASFVIGDANHNDSEELIMVVWKKGSFGADKPFWIQLNDRKTQCHLFLFNLLDTRIKPVWMSSALHRPIKSLQIKDTNQDGKNELIVQESSYCLLNRLINSDASEPTLWQWKGWGFYLLR